MAIFLNSTVGQYLINTGAVINPSVTGEMTFGIWFMPDILTNGEIHTVMSLDDGATTISVQSNSTTADILSLSGPIGTSGLLIAMTLGQWHFAIIRYSATATNAYLHVLFPDGSIDYQETFISPQLGAFRINLGVRTDGGGTVDETSLWHGSIAEYWCATQNVQVGSIVQESTIRQLAYGGPFSLPTINMRVVDYRSLRQSGTSSADGLGDYSHGRYNRQAWTAPAGYTISRETPPLPYWYERPVQRKIVMPV